jgi:hypothetical protein
VAKATSKNKIVVEPVSEKIAKHRAPESTLSEPMLLLSIKGLVARVLLSG